MKHITLKEAKQKLHDAFIPRHGYDEDQRFYITYKDGSVLCTDETTKRVKETCITRIDFYGSDSQFTTEAHVITEETEELIDDLVSMVTNETAHDAEPKNTNDKSHTALQEGLNPTRVFYKGEWRVLVLFLPIKGGHDFADRCEIKALPERNYEDIATSLENGKHGFSEWYLYDPETTCKRLKRYQDTAMKKFTAKTGVQVLEAELNHPERKAVVYGHDKNGIPIQSGVIPVQELGETLTDYEAKCADSDFFIYDPDTGKYDVLGEHPPKRFMKMFPELGGVVV